MDVAASRSAGVELAESTWGFHAVSLKTRLLALIVALMTAVVVALSGLHLHGFVEEWSAGVLERSELASQQVKAMVLERVDEQASRRVPPPATLDQSKRLWAEIVAGDKAIASLLDRTAAHSQAIVEINVAGEVDQILASSNPTRVAASLTPLPDFGAWRRRPLLRRLAGVLSRGQDYQVTIPLGVRGQAHRIFTVQVVVSSVLLRDALLPQLRNLALVSAACLALSILLAAFSANLALRPLARVVEIIDRLARGQFSPEVAARGLEARELAIVESKLNLLGQQFQGARADATQLRSNIEQLLERLEEAVLLFDNQGRLIMAGPAVERILGIGRVEMGGRRRAEIFPPATPLGAAIEEAVRSRQAIKDRILALPRAQEPDGRVLVTVELLEDASEGGAAGTLVTLRDAETRRQLASQLDVSHRLSAISRLTSGVAHEIKNPLNAIALRLEVLRTLVSEQAPAADSEIALISREIMRLDRVVKTFLDFTRPLELTIRQVDMAALVGEVAALMTPQAARQKVIVEFDAPPERIAVGGDRDLLKQALLNVVVNGIEAMKEGGTLRIEIRQEAAVCLVRVTDQGPGIPPECRDKVFKLYFTTKEKGSGIGLAMAFRAVQLHNGTIEFTSRAGEGCSFELRFPTEGWRE